MAAAVAVAVVQVKVAVPVEAAAMVAPLAPVVPGVLVTMLRCLCAKQTPWVVVALPMMSLMATQHSAVAPIE